MFSNPYKTYGRADELTLRALAEKKAKEKVKEHLEEEGRGEQKSSKDEQ